MGTSTVTANVPVRELVVNVVLMQYGELNVNLPNWTNKYLYYHNLIGRSVGMAALLTY